MEEVITEMREGNKKNFKFDSMISQKVESIFKIYEGIEAFIVKINTNRESYTDLFKNFVAFDIE